MSQRSPHEMKVQPSLDKEEALKQARKKLLIETELTEASTSINTRLKPEDIAQIISNNLDKVTRYAELNNPNSMDHLFSSPITHDTVEAIRTLRNIIVTMFLAHTNNPVTQKPYQSLSELASDAHAGSILKGRFRTDLILKWEESMENVFSKQSKEQEIHKNNEAAPTMKKR